MTVLEDMTRAMTAVPIWVGLGTSSGGEPVDGYTRIPVGGWSVAGRTARSEVTFTAGRNWGTVEFFLLADNDGQIWRSVAVDPVTPRPGDTVTVAAWFELEATT
jgi:hypothetical protein